MENKVVTRFAPSPTGFMHIGGVRTALFAWLWARKNNGTFILRIEDTDKKREVEGSIDHIVASLKWTGIDWDEGIDIGGPNAPYKQSERLDTYIKYAKILIDKGLAYADPYTEEEVVNFRKKAEEEKRAFLYREHRPENPPVWDGTQPLRFKTNPKKYKWNDLIRGDLEVGEEAVDDIVLIKRDGYPTYNFAHIIDDFVMGVTYIFRADEFISSTPNYLALYEALEIERPKFASLPPILGEAGTKKLGKRDGAKDILDYSKEGYLPSAMMNFLAFIGWNPGEGNNKEIMLKNELIESFDIKHIQKAGGKFNEEKLEWINKEHIKLLPPEEIERNILEWLPEGMKEVKLVPLILERISKWVDVKTMAESGELDLFFKAPEIDEVKLKEKIVYKNSTPEKTVENLAKVIEALQNIDEKEFNLENIKNTLMLIAEMADSRGEVLHPVRYALSGMDKSPDPFIIASLIGKNETISRLQKAI
jgi:glutamyl-tRNA synthetase